MLCSVLKYWVQRDDMVCKQWGGWLGLSMMDNSLFSILLFTTASSVLCCDFLEAGTRQEVFHISGPQSRFRLQLKSRLLSGAGLWNLGAVLIRASSFALVESLDWVFCLFIYYLSLKTIKEDVLKKEQNPYKLFVPDWHTAVFYARLCQKVCLLYIFITFHNNCEHWAGIMK